MKDIISILISPFKQSLSIFCGFCLMIGFIPFLADIIYQPYGPVHFLGTLVRDIMDSYFLTLIFNYIPKHTRKTYCIFIYTLLSIYFVIDLFTFVNFKRMFDSDIAAIILGTNWHEMKEFIILNFSFKIVSIIILCVILAYYIYRCYQKPSIISVRLCYLLLVGTLISILTAIIKPVPGYGLTPYKIYQSSLATKVPNLHEYLQHPQLKLLHKQPQNIIVILGESLTRKHSSLYGYDKETNPLLTQLVQDSLLYPFTNIESDGLHTIQAFQTIMSTYRSSFSDSIKWYECLTLPEIIRESSYKSLWVSNQSYKGLSDNIPSLYAELCDSMVFVGDKYAAILKKDLDEMVLPHLININQQSKNFIFVHLMGSHPDFQMRYPASFSRFTESDYKNYSPSQRHQLATYDNSVLYNDAIVYQIIDKFKDSEAIILYFSDHALDVFESSSDYCGHGISYNPLSAKAGMAIPFMIYFSSAYKKNFPSTYHHLINQVHKHYSTGDILYTLVDIMGYQLSPKDSFHRNSLLQTYNLSE